MDALKRYAIGTGYAGLALTLAVIGSIAIAYVLLEAWGLAGRVKKECDFLRDRKK